MVEVMGVTMVVVTTEAITDMAYVFDRDRLTRGVGAIASRDHSPARLMSRVASAAATRSRDQKMAAISRGALGRVNLTGAVGGGGSGSSRGGTYSRVNAPPTTLPPPTWIPPSTPPPTLPPPPREVETIPPVVTPITPVLYPGGSSTPVPGTPSGVMMEPPATVPPPNMTPPILVEPPAPAGDSMRTALIVGGAAVAAYFLFFRKRSP